MLAKKSDGGMGGRPRWKSAVSPRPIPSTARPFDTSWTVAMAVAERGRVTGRRVGHPGHEPQALGHRRPEGHGDERITDQVLRIGVGHPVPARGFGALGDRLGQSRLGHPLREQLEHHTRLPANRSRDAAWGSTTTLEVGASNAITCRVSTS